MNKPFEDNEKRYILAEMIKASQIDVSAVVEFIKASNILPNWMDMHYPNGRTPNECKQVAEGMGIASPVPLPPQFQPAMPAPQYLQLCQQQQQHQQQQQQQQHQQQQQQQQHLQQQQQQLPQPPQPQYPQLAPFPPGKRKYSDELIELAPKRLAAAPETPVPRPRAVNIQPRPSPNGTPPAGPPTASPVTTVPRNPSRRRGRPSKADKEAQARAFVGSIGASHPLLAPAPRYIPAATSGTPPSVGVLLRASSEPKENEKGKARSVTPQRLREPSHESGEEQTDIAPRRDPGPIQEAGGSIKRESTPQPATTSTSTRMGTGTGTGASIPNLIQESPTSDGPANASASTSQPPVSRVTVANLLKAGIPAS